MYKQTQKIAKGVGVGLIAGTAIAAIGTQIGKRNRRPSKSFKRSAGKAVHTVNSLISDVERMLR